MKLSNSIPAYLLKDFGYCRDFVEGRAENLTFCSQLVSRRLRPFLYAIYAFIWTARDFINLPGQDDDFNLQKLDDWSRRLSLAKSGQTDHPIFRAMRHTFEVTSLPENLLQNILIAHRMDITNKRYETLDDLTEYCRFAVNPIGQIILYLSNEVDFPQSLQTTEKIYHSDAFWTAMQLTSFWQNLGHNTWNHHPLYLPKREMQLFGVHEETILQRRYTSMLGSLILHLVEETRILFAKGEPLLKQVAWPLRLELATVTERNMAMLDRIESCGGNILRKRLDLTQQERLGCLWRAFGRASV
ncbi:MAG: squalene/phytoene synthase family protein [Magnetococcales bacterium]|nr:squalene/phytoene synthase family protein [Magnetococcales bacterium]